jgi:imidazolonepropionase-like amidohydrolase
VSEPCSIRAGWLIDGGGGPVRQNVFIQIEKGLVRRIEDFQSGIEPDLDLSSCTLTPALADAHAHLFMSPTPDEAVRQGQLSAAYHDLKPVMTDHADQFMAAGVLAVRDGGDFGGYSLRLRDERPAGSWPIIKSPGRAWRAPGRYGRLIGRGVAGDDLAGVIADQPDGADHVKIVNSGLNSLLEFGHQTAPQFTTDELREAVRAAHGRGLTVMVHANGVEPVRRAIEAGVDSIEHGFFMGREIFGRLSDAACVWVPTAVTMKGFSENLPAGDPRIEVARRNLDHQLDQLRLARQLGVTVACGTDAGTLGVAHGAAIFEEMGLLMEAGFSLNQAVAAASRVGAELCGVSDRIGRLAPGRPATFLVFRQSPERMAATLTGPAEVYAQGRRLSRD